MHRCYALFSEKNPSLRNEYVLSLHKKTPKGSHKLTFYSFEKSYKPFMSLIF